MSVMKTRSYKTGRRFTAITVHEDAESTVITLRSDDSLSGAVNRIANEAIKLLQAAGFERDQHGRWGTGAMRVPRKATDEAVHVLDAPVHRAAQIVNCAEFLKGVTKLPFNTPGLEREKLEAAYALGRLATLHTVYGAEDHQRAVAAKAPRPKRADPLRAELVVALAVQRREGRTLALALAALSDSAHGVRVVPDGPSLRVSTSTSTSKLQRVLSARTLDTLWSEAAKLKPNRRRPAITDR